MTCAVTPASSPLAEAPEGRSSRGLGRWLLAADRGVVRSEASTHDFDAYGSELLQRIAGTVAIMLYEMKISPDGTLEV